MNAALHEADSTAPADDLLARLNVDGYLFLRQLIEPKAVLDVRRAILETLDDCGWLVGDPADAIPSDRARREEADSDPEYFVAYTAIQRLQVLHELAHDAALVGITEKLIGEQVLVHPRKIARIGLPRDEFVVDAHQDHPLIQGTPDVLTTWIPVGDCPDEMGGLKVLAGSHRAGLRAVETVPNVGGLRVAGGAEGDWRTSDFRAGDVLVFHSLTVHAAKRNHTDQLRLSVDFRYQAMAEPVVKASLIPHFYPRVPGHTELTRDWTSRDAVDVRGGEAVIVDYFDPFDGPVPNLNPRLVSID